MYIELFLLDNAIMTLLIIRSAAPLARLKSQVRPTVMACLLSAAFSACAVQDERLTALPFKLALLLLLCRALAPVTPLELLRAGLGVLAATFFLGGLCYGCFGVLYSGALFCTSALRLALLGGLCLTLLPRLLTALRRKTPSVVELEASTFAGSARLLARVDTGNTLKSPSGKSVLIVRKDSVLFPPKGVFTEGMELVPYSTIDKSGLLIALPARVRAGQVELNCLAAASPQPLHGCDALIFDLEECM